MLSSDVGPLQIDLVGVHRAFSVEVSLVAENLALRQQINVLRRTAPKRPRFASIDRLIFVGLFRGLSTARDALAIVQPATVIRWHRAGFRTYCRWKSRVAQHVRERGFTALKTNIFRFDGSGPELYMPGFVRSPGGPELNPSLRVEEALDKQLAAFRDGTGKDVEFLLDLNFNFKTEGYVRLVRALEQRQHRLMWVEIDSFDPRALALIRRSITTPLASCASLFGRRQFKDYLEGYAMDVGIVDLRWNGILESMKIAAMAEAYEVNCAPHNFYGHMSTLMSAHFCAAIPNFRIMEIDIDDVPWKDDLVTEPPRIENWHLIVPTKPGWGGDARHIG
jgi:L-alanine-DL-glutamate epimerase-like enolase superfamily enzyme